MDYEKAYKEVINSIKRIYDNTDSYTKKLIDKEFPELNKKKDESIRQALLNQFKNYQKKKINQGFGYTNEEIIAWLEKQKKKTWNEDAGKLCLDAIGLLRDYAEGVDKNSQLGQKISKADAFLSDLYHEAFYPQTYNMRKDLKTCWNEEDERIYKSIIDDTVQENQLCKEQIDWLKSLKDRVRSQSQQKQEWSAEDEANMDAIWKACGHVYGMKYQCILGDWLKSLKDRVQPQLKEEWNKEDEEMFDAIIADIQFTQKTHNHEVNQIVYEREIDWLKSIKDRVQLQPKQEWSEVNDSMIEGIKIAILNYYDKENAEEIINWLKSIKDKVQPQLKQEWSEYDNKIIKNIEDSLNVYSESHPCLKVVVAEELEWLKSLKDKIQPQTKQEWSEEDEKYSSYVCAALQCYYKLREDRNNTNGQEDLDKARNWLYNKLKSLKPHWKPSEEQMKTLEYVTRGNSYPHLTSLYQDLKKF
jgi:hypothetical protein